MRPTLSFFNLAFTRGKIVSCDFCCGYIYIASDFVSGLYDRRNYSTQVLMESESSAHPSTSISNYYNRIDLPPPRWSRFKNWQEERQDKLTASTFSQAVGMFSHRRVQLWLEKIGAIEPFPVWRQTYDSHWATLFSYENELEAFELYRCISGNYVILPDSFTVYGNDHDREWLGASPDGFIQSGDCPSWGLLEIKCPYFRGKKILTSPWKRLPLYYIPQAQGLMEILDADWMELFVWTVEGYSLFRIYRDREYWAILNAALYDFWWCHVQPAKLLFDEYVITNPCRELEALKPAPRHEFCEHLVIKGREICDQSPLLFRDRREMKLILQELRSRRNFGSIYPKF